MSEIQKSLIREYGKAAATLVCERTITKLEEIKDTLSGDDSPLENAWEEICCQVQGEESIFWDTYQDLMHDSVLGILDQLPHRDIAALWLQTEEGWEWHYDQETEEEQSPLSLRGKNASSIPINHDEVVSYIVRQFVLSSAQNFTNLNIEVFLDGGDANEANKRRLVDLMPLDTTVTDLWDWDIHFEDKSFDDIESVAFCTNDEIKKYSECLAEDFEFWIDEYDLDYDQDKWETPDAFSTWIKSECLKFITGWRANVRKEFGY